MPLIVWGYKRKKPKKKSKIFTVTRTLYEEKRELPLVHEEHNEIRETEAQSQEEEEEEESRVRVSSTIEARSL